MIPNSIKRFGYKAFVALPFVFWLFGIGLNNQAHASCGDYLQHKSSKSPGQLDRLGNANEDSSPQPSCKNGRCKSAPQPMPIESSRLVIPRQQPDHLRLCDLANDTNFLGLVINGDDAMPIEPSLDLPDPPPRAATL